MTKKNLMLNFLKDKNVASIVPTTKRTVAKICRAVNFKKDIIVVEYGPGNGVFTKYFLSQMTEKSKIIAVDQNSNFVSYLKKIKDPRLTVVKGNAEDIKTILQKNNVDAADYVVSGIPLSFLKYPVREKLIRETSEILRAGGKFLVYQFTNQARGLIIKYFNSVKWYMQPINVPPLFVFEAVKTKPQVKLH